MKRSFQTELLLCILFVAVGASITIMSQPATTNPSYKDSDHDGYLDGPDRLYEEDGVLMWHFGEDKNANGRYEPEGMDGILGTADDEFDPNNPASHPEWPRKMTYREAAEYGHDADFDGVMDSKEDKNLNGIYEPLGTDGEAMTIDDETDFLDRDTDDDGLSDGYELGFRPINAIPFNRPLISMDNPDSDNDGLPDGLECGVTQPVKGFGYVKGTDVNATFEFQGQQRKTFIIDLDPGSMTHPMDPDTNGDGVSDGAQDLNANGRFDPDEDEPADPSVGFVGFESLASSNPHRFYTIPAAVAPQTLNDVMIEGTDVYDIAYQATSDEEVPDVVVSDSSIIDVRSIERLENTRFWIITIEWVSPGLASFKVVSQDLPGGETPSILIETFEVDAIYDSARPMYCIPSLFATEASSSNLPPYFNAYPAKEISWHCISPLPLPEHWYKPASSQVILQVITLWSLMSRNEENVEDVLSALLDWVYSGSETVSLERQWMFAFLWTEVGGDPYKFNAYKVVDEKGKTISTKYTDVHDQLQKILAALTVQARLAYVYAQPGANSWGGWARYNRKGVISNKLVPRTATHAQRSASDYKIRLWDIIDGFGDGVPHLRKGKVRYGNDTTGNKWEQLMTWSLTPAQTIGNDNNTPKQNADGTFPVQWRLKPKAEIMDLATESGNTKEFARLILAARIAMEGLIGVYQNSNPTQTLTGRFFESLYPLNNDGLDNSHPVTNYFLAYTLTKPYRKMHPSPEPAGLAELISEDRIGSHYFYRFLPDKP